MSDEPLVTRFTDVPLHDPRSSSCVAPHERALKLAADSTFALFARGSFSALPSHRGLSGGTAFCCGRRRDDRVCPRSRQPGGLGDPLRHAADRESVSFRQVIHQDFDLTGISRFVLGPYWRVASPAERRQFRRLFVD